MSKVVLTRREKRLSWMIAICAAIILAIILYPIVDRRLPRVVVAQPVHSPIMPGADLLVLFNIYPNFYCPADVDETIWDGRGRAGKVDRRPGVANSNNPQQPNATGSEDPSLTNRIPYERTVRVPTLEGAAAGPSRYEADVYYHCNWFQQYVWPLHVHRILHFVFAKPKSLKEQIRELLPEENNK